MAAWAIPGVAVFAMTLFFAKLVAYTFLYWLPYYISTTEVGGRTLTPSVGVLQRGGARPGGPGSLPGGRRQLVGWVGGWRDGTDVLHLPLLLPLLHCVVAAGGGQPVHPV